MRTNSGRTIAVRHLDNSYGANDLTDKEIESAWEATYSGDGHLFWRGCETTPGDRRHRISQHADNRRLHSAGRSVEYHQVLLHLHTPAVGAHRLRVTFLSPIILLLLGGLIDVKETTCVSNGERGHWQKKLTLFGKAEETQIKQMLLIPPIESYSGLLETIRPCHTRGLSNLWNIWNFKTKQSLHQGSVVTASLLSAQHPNQRATVQLLRVRLYKSL